MSTELNTSAFKQRLENAEKLVEDRFGRIIENLVNELMLNGIIDLAKNYVCRTYKLNDFVSLFENENAQINRANQFLKEPKPPIPTEIDVVIYSMNYLCNKRGYGLSYEITIVPYFEKFITLYLTLPK